jgi:hypothetical protein
VIEIAVTSKFSPDGGGSQFPSRSPGDILRPVNAGKNHFEKNQHFSKIVFRKIMNFQRSIFRHQIGSLSDFTLRTIKDSTKKNKSFRGSGFSF